MMSLGNKKNSQKEWRESASIINEDWMSNYVCTNCPNVPYLIANVLQRVHVICLYDTGSASAADPAPTSNHPWPPMTPSLQSLVKGKKSAVLLFRHTPSMIEHTMLLIIGNCTGPHGIQQSKIYHTYHGHFDSNILPAHCKKHCLLCRPPFPSLSVVFPCFLSSTNPPFGRHPTHIFFTDTG